MYRLRAIFGILMFTNRWFFHVDILCFVYIYACSYSCKCYEYSLFCIQFDKLELCTFSANDQNLKKNNLINAAVVFRTYIKKLVRWEGSILFIIQTYLLQRLYNVVFKDVFQITNMTFAFLCSMPY